MNRLTRRLPIAEMPLGAHPVIPDDSPLSCFRLVDSDTGYARVVDYKGTEIMTILDPRFEVIILNSEGAH